MGTGYVFHTIGIHSDATETRTDTNGVSQTSSFHYNFRSGLGIGVVAAAGVRFHEGRFAFLPEFRYTRWGGDDNLTRKNEATFLMGITF